MLVFILFYAINSIQTASSVTLSPEEESTIIDKIVDAHNKYRKMHDAKPLIFDVLMNSDAKSCAESDLVIEGKSCSFGDKIGQNTWTNKNTNLQTLMSSDSLDHNPVRAWYEEGKIYPGFYKPDLPKRVDSFTQLVWRSTKDIGCSIVSKKQVVVVCAYLPRGNLRDKSNLNHTILNYKYNVVGSAIVGSPASGSVPVGSPAVGSSTVVSPAADESTSIWWYVTPVFVVAAGFMVWLSRSSTEDVSDLPPQDESDSPPEYESESPPDYE